MKIINQTTYSATAYSRKHVLDSYALLKNQGATSNAILKVLKVPRATYYRWLANYKIEGMAGLENDSRRPLRKRKRSWKSEDVILIQKTRNLFPLWGKNKLSVYLAKQSNKEISKSTVGRILKYLLNAGKIQKLSIYASHKKRRVFTEYAQPWKYGMKAAKPGQLLQVDHMTVTAPGIGIVKHFQATCPITKVIYAQAYGRATSTIAALFLLSMQNEFPFKIESIQVDGGSEFMGEFEQKCSELGISLYVLPPRRPQYNGNVERSNGTLRYEFYEQLHDQKSLQELRLELSSYRLFYNTIRPHQALHYCSPMEYLSMNGAPNSHM